jgi:hypothetical protein
MERYSDRGMEGVQSLRRDSLADVDGVDIEHHNPEDRKMNEPAEGDGVARHEGARQERRAILAIVEQHLRQVTHGHGADGARVLQHLLLELEARDRVMEVPAEPAS